tara:strand:+ start:150 stop:866 length:717 start_codon:yes stop_codon:yes gene_type:complete
MRLTSDKKIFVPDEDDWYRWGADYEQNEYDNIIKYIPNFDVALDVGAHVGIWSRRLAEKFKTVVAFEPVPKHIECWKKNMDNFIKENSDWDNYTTLHSVALGHENGTATMKVPDTTNTGMASLVHEIYNVKTQKRWVQPGWEKFPEIEVETKTLDSYEFEKIDFIKIDVEWFELRVLQGAEQTIRKHKPVMYIEMHDIQAFNFMMDIDCGYRIFEAQGVNRLYKSNTVLEELKEMLNK